MEITAYTKDIVAHLDVRMRRASGCNRQIATEKPWAYHFSEQSLRHTCSCREINYKFPLRLCFRY